MWLHVAVDDALAVAVSQRIQQLFRTRQHLCLWQSALSLDAVGQAFPLDKVHYQVSVAFLFEKVGDTDQVRVVKAGQDGRLLLELPAQLGQGLGVQTRLGDHLLERDKDTEARVPGAVDRPHPALAQQGDDAVAVLKNLSTRKCHTSPFAVCNSLFVTGPDAICLTDQSSHAIMNSATVVVLLAIKVATWISNGTGNEKSTISRSC